MDIGNFLKELTLKGTKLWVKEDKLKYEGFKGSITPEILDKLKKYKLDIIKYLKERSEYKEPFPLSFGQQGLWYQYQLAPESPAYNLVYLSYLQPELDIILLDECFKIMFKRYSILSAKYEDKDEICFQKLQDIEKIKIEIIDASLWTEDELNEWIENEKDRPFDLKQDILARFKLINRKINNEITNILLIVIHHIISDFWSLELFIKELDILYESKKAGKDITLPYSSLQYKDYIEWQKEMLSQSYGEKLRKYWLNQLSGELPVLELPTDHPRPNVRRYLGKSQFFEIDSVLSEEIKKLSKMMGTTPFIIFLTSFQILLYRYTMNEEFLVGSGTSGRNKSEFETIFGFISNMIVLRFDLSKNPEIKELINKTREILLSGIEHQDYPFQLLLEELKIKRDPSISPLIQVSFGWNQSEYSEGLETTGGRICPEKLILNFFEGEQRGAPFDLDIIIESKINNFKMKWRYNTDLFEPVTISRMIGHFTTILQDIVNNTHKRVSDITILTEEEKHKIVYEWNNTKVDYPKDKTMIDLFEEQVEKTPDAIAVIYEEDKLTYKELNERANQLAHYLIHNGVKADTLVGICIERSLEMIIGLLGILKAGGAYVPIDPNYPKERIDFIIKDSNAHVVLTQDEIKEILLNTYSLENPKIKIFSDNLAYVMYTSGSTGEPKGVSVPHAGIVRLVIKPNYVNISSEDRFIQFAPIAFDASTFEIWAALLNGASLIVMTSNKDSLLELGNEINRHKVTVLWLTSSLFNLIVDESIEILRPIRQLLAGGEELSVNHIQKALKALPECQIINGYGPTENTTFTCCYSIERTKYDRSIPIGKPINGTIVYILDNHLNRVPISIRGEIYIGGDGLARGYLNRPDLTKERFIETSFGRLYKTGDLGRFLPDGNIEYIGRIDNQIKLRGFRIELGEIESVIDKHIEVKESAVILQEKRLIAYITSENKNIELKEYLKQYLPDYMIPASIVVIDKMPQTPNGKIDRKALSKIEHNFISSEYIIPSTEIEQKLANIWKQTLKIEQIGIHDNFFELGGDSILSIQIVSKAKGLNI
ncbi:MAG: amino acid adenylation domain-containing protein, partial [Desulfobacterales bacterium]|nr:amino acid adenylation domain-containing protein [Desulfobacterales bacterium]